MPQSLRLDNAPEITGKALDLWAYLYGVTLDFSRPGKWTNNAFIESFNGQLPKECLNQCYFSSFHQARRQVEEWRTE